MSHQVVCLFIKGQNVYKYKVKHFISIIIFSEEFREEDRRR